MKHGGDRKMADFIRDYLFILVRHGHWWGVDILGHLGYIKYIKLKPASFTFISLLKWTFNDIVIS